MGQRFEETEDGKLKISVGHKQRMGHDFYLSEYRTGAHKDKKREAKGSRSQVQKRSIKEHDND